MSTNPRLDDCGCCGTTQTTGTPVAPGNVPGLPALDYRIGTHSEFRKRMLAALSKQRALDRLTTRDDDDPAIALLDAWATTLDVLTFYQERIANEGYLRTAAERRSVLELSREIGYELAPGVAAGTYLAFTIEDAAGSPGYAEIPAGARVQSIPGPGELPQTFETSEDITARAEWNAMTPKMSRVTTPRFGDRDVWLDGTSTGLKPGDLILFVGNEQIADPTLERWDVRRILTVEPDKAASRTRVTWKDGLGWTLPPYKIDPAGQGVTVHAFRRRASLFGANAPDWRTMPTDVRTAYTSAANAIHGATVIAMANRTEWPNFTITGVDSTTNTIHLDAVYSEVTAGSWVVLSRPDYQELYRVDEAIESSRANFTLTSKTTRLKLLGENLIAKFNNGIRDTVVFAQSEELPRAETPITDPIDGNTILLDGEIDGLTAGQVLIVSGVDATSGETASEVVVLRTSSASDGATTITFDPGLTRRYIRDGATVCANIVAATHGETKKEVLGSGNGSTAFQTFALRSTPLTYVSASTSAGMASTLEVRVDDILWDEAQSFYGRGRRDRIYVTRIDDDGNVTVEFGDGITGARVPTGSENVTAKYRIGTGTEGMVDAGKLSLLMTRPLGVRGVTNPIAATGAEDPESRDDARTNAPFTVMTLGRIVSLQDFEDFSRSFPGIAKAQAVSIWSGEHQVVHITVSGADGTSVAPSSDLYRNLKDAIRSSGNWRHFEVDTYQALSFRLEAEVLVDTRYRTDDVLSDVEATLRATFSFAKRAFAQPVVRSEVLATIQNVEGVEAVSLTALYRSGSARTVESVIPSLPARWNTATRTIIPAQLLTLAADGIILQEMPR